MGEAAEKASALSRTFEDARFAVASEESLERKYRLEPSPAVRTRHHEAGEALLNALRAARHLDTSLATGIDKLIVDHEDYLLSINRMFAAIDAGDSVLATRIDGSEVDPKFEALEIAVFALADQQREVTQQNLDLLARVQSTILIATPIVFLIGAVLAGVCWSFLIVYRGKVADGIRREALAVRASERRYRSLIQNSSDLVLICSEEGIITYQSPSAGTIWGYSEDRLINQPLSEMIYPTDRPAFRDLIDQLKMQPAASKNIEVRLFRFNGDSRDVDLHLANQISDVGINGLVVTARDVTERREYERQLSHQAFYDSLTNLPNRALLRDRIQQALTRAAHHQDKICLIFLDLDNFKKINDSLGHQVGDELLRLVANRLRTAVREDNTVARLGGDEFVMLLEGITSEDDAAIVANDIKEALAQPLNLAGRDFSITTSIGIAIADGVATSKDQGLDGLADNLLRDADIAMYRAKANGKARHVVFDSSMQREILDQLELEADLEKAIDNDELVLHYQPIVSFNNGQIEEVEALIRWRHPIRGLISPAEFIPTAESTGLIVPIGRWVLEQACRQAVAWDTQFPTKPPLTVSVNLSARQFQQPNLATDVERILRKMHFPATRLKLEITESAVMGDDDATMQTLSELKGLGIKLAIDDFGTGYSSLSYLKRLPIDCLKIDRSFVNDLGRDGEGAAIVQAIISMAKSLGLSITAEGIETTEQTRFLLYQHCNFGQGYLFSRPVDAENLSLLLNAADLPSVGERAA